MFEKFLLLLWIARLMRSNHTAVSTRRVTMLELCVSHVDVESRGVVLASFKVHGATPVAARGAVLKDGVCDGEVANCLVDLWVQDSNRTSGIPSVSDLCF